MDIRGFADGFFLLDFHWWNYLLIMIQFNISTFLVPHVRTSHVPSIELNQIDYLPLNCKQTYCVRKTFKQKCVEKRGTVCSSCNSRSHAESMNVTGMRSHHN